MFIVLPQIALLLSLFLWPAASHAVSEAEWNSLMTQVNTMLTQGKAKEGVPLALEAVKQAEELYGKGSPNVLTSLGLLAMLYQGAGNQEQAAAIRGQMALQAMNRSRDLASSRISGKRPMSEQATAPQEDQSKPAQRTVPSNDPLAGKDLLAEQARAVQEHMSKHAPYNSSPNAAQAGNAQKQVIDSARAMGMGDQADAMQKMRETLEKRRRSTGAPDKHKEMLDDVKMMSEVESHDPDLIALLKPFHEGARQKAFELRKATGVAVERVGIFTDADLPLCYLGSQGRYAEALPIFERAVKLGEERLATGSTFAMIRRLSLARLYFRLAMYERAEPLFSRLLEESQRDEDERKKRKEEHLSSMHDSTAAMKQFSQAMKEKDPATARYFEERTRQLEGMTNQLDSMNKSNAERSHAPQADYLYNLGQIYQKLGRYKDAEQQYQQAVGLSSKGYIVMDLVLLYMDMGDYAKAKSLAREMQVKLTGFGGQGSDEKAILLDKQAQVYMALGNIQEAEKFLTGALKMWKSVVHGGQEVYLMNTMNKLARVYRASGRYTEAQTLYHEARKVSPEKVEMVPPDGAPVISDLAQLQQELGMYTVATLSGTRARDVQRKGLGPTHPETAATVMMLGELYKDQGDYEAAKKHFEEAGKSFEDRLGKSHPSTASSLMSLARLYRQWGKYDDAKPLYERALGIREEKLLADHLDIAESLTELARLHQDMGDFQEAERKFRRALQIHEKVLGFDHQETGVSIINLADVLLDQRKYDDAEKGYVKARLVFEKAVGNEHPVTALALVGLGRLRALQNRPKDAFDFLEHAASIEGRVLLGQLGTARESRKLQLLERASHNKDFVIALVEQHLKQDEAATRFALELLLTRKGLVFDDQAQLQKSLAPALRSKWMDLRQQVATLELHPPIGMVPDDLRKRLAQAHADLEKFEAQQSQLVSVHRSQARATIEQVAKAIPPKSALIEFTKAAVVDWSTLKIAQDDFSYLAFVLRPDRTITLVKLGDGLKLEKAIKSFQSSTAPETPAATTQELSQVLYEKIWTPLSAAVGDAKTILVSPDGQLNLVPFAALQNPNGGAYLIEHGNIAYLTSGRDVIRGSSSQSQSSDLVLVANPRFDTSPSKEKQEVKSVKDAEPVRSRETASRFAPLPGTQVEAENIPSFIRAPSARKQILTQAAANEAAVLSVQNPRILHFATHGYFLKDKGSRATTQAENVLFRSGLALAGANEASAASDSLDGLLTAYEVSGMDLRGTDLVTLSACQTGNGEVRNGEGVFGLRRVFALAGAKNLVMSLWRVDDAWTARQMEQFYKAYGEGKSAVEALRTAQLATIAALRKEGKPEDPKLWAPFIVQGMPRENTVRM